MSDAIESHIKSVLNEKDMIEIKRVELAHYFCCVPSQINYVINTRFTISQGYIVESKRGGGGFIRIKKVIHTEHSVLLDLKRNLEGELTEQEAEWMLHKLVEFELITIREEELMKAIFVRSVLSNNSKKDSKIRANMMETLLERLGYEERE